MSSSSQFRTTMVTTPDDLAAVHALRYQVYCEERGFLDGDRFPENQEFDEFDRRSAHFAAFDEQGEVAAAARLVLSAEGEALPYQQFCSVYDDVELPRAGRAVEISRVVLNQGYRRPPAGGPAGSVMMGVYRQMYLYCRENGIEYWYAAMERPLMRLLGTYGFGFRQIGPRADYFGPVAVHLAHVSELLQPMACRHPEQYAWFTNRSRDFAAAA